MKNLTADVWNETVSADKNAVLLDVRTPGECEEGIQPNAITLDILNEDVFMFGIEELDKDKTYYVYCRSGKRSLSACRIMEDRGFDVVNLEGGMIAWSQVASV